MNICELERCGHEIVGRVLAERISAWIVINVVFNAFFVVVVVVVVNLKNNEIKK